MIYYISDMHFRHRNIIRFDERPFADIEQMNDIIIKNWNERVTDEDPITFLAYKSITTQI